VEDLKKAAKEDKKKETLRDRKQADEERKQVNSSSIGG
jgi:hypothetical protein